MTTGVGEPTGAMCAHPVHSLDEFIRPQKCFCFLFVKLVVFLCFTQQNKRSRWFLDSKKKNCLRAKMVRGAWLAPRSDDFSVWLTLLD